MRILYIILKVNKTHLVLVTMAALTTHTLTGVNRVTDTIYHACCVSYTDIYTRVVYPWVLCTTVGINHDVVY